MPFWLVQTCTASGGTSVGRPLQENVRPSPQGAAPSPLRRLLAGGEIHGGMRASRPTRESSSRSLLTTDH